MGFHKGTLQLTLRINQKWMIEKLRAVAPVKIQDPLPSHWAYSRIQIWSPMVEGGAGFPEGRAFRRKSTNAQLFAKSCYYHLSSEK